MLRVHPRDTNYPDPIKHSTCVVRPEAVKLFNLHMLQHSDGLYFGYSLKQL
jgi:hypothetical protein